MKTRKKDYKYCDPEIAQRLQVGQEVLCKVFCHPNGVWEKMWVFGYSKGYYATTQGAFRTVEIYEPVEYVRKASEIVRWLENSGYTPDSNGSWSSTKHAATFSFRMFQFCGTNELGEWEWLPEWLEEK